MQTVRSERASLSEILLESSVSRIRSKSSVAEAGFTLVELLIVMSVILILMTLAIPEMQKVIKRSNETSAIQSLRDLNSQEGTYNSTYPTHGFACTLAELGGKAGSGPPSPEAAQLIQEDLASGVKAGYTFNITCGSKTTVNNVDQYNSYVITAVPNAVGKTGDRGFCTDGNAIRYDAKGGTNCTDLLQ
ncbi:MAG TPA: type II secretion system protein [Acidobacteriaceae bacterium]|nr:type II secretion system protein [Acidobacteriaceae bacterium]